MKKADVDSAAGDFFRHLTNEQRDALAAGKPIPDATKEQKDFLAAAKRHKRKFSHSFSDDAGKVRTLNVK